jgi:glycosyltransferase involved in cell wall biosynthesis
MGFGHYERLLLNHYFSEYPEQVDAANVVYSGRGAIVSDLTISIKQSVLGYAIQRNTVLPWGIASNLFRISLAKAGIVHSLSMDFPIPPKIPSIITIHDIPPYHFTDEGVLPLWSRNLLNSVSLIHVPSEFSKRELISNLDADEDKIHVIPYGLESEVFNNNVDVLSSEDMKRIGLPAYYILFAAGASQRKNLPNLLSAWLQVQERYPDVQLILAGPHRVNEILSKHPKCNAKYIGYLNRQDLPRAMKSSLFVVCPSIYEGFGLPPLEALACGVPVLTTELGAIPEVVGDAALMCPTGTVDDLVSGLQTLLDNPGLLEKLRAKGPDQASRFSWTNHVTSLYKLYKELI